MRNHLQNTRQKRERRRVCSISHLALYGPRALQPCITRVPSVLNYALSLHMATYKSKKREDEEFAQFGTLPFRQEHHTRAFYYYLLFVYSHLFSSVWSTIAGPAWVPLANNWFETQDFFAHSLACWVCGPVRVFLTSKISDPSTRMASAHVSLIIN
jgi:hypothetical protein